MTKPKQDKTKKIKEDKPTIIKTVDNITVYF